MAKSPYYIFFYKAQNGRGTSLFSLEGQMLNSRTSLKPNIMTHGCESLRRKYPTGTIFAAPQKGVRLKSGCYVVEQLHAVVSPDKKTFYTDDQNVLTALQVMEQNLVKQAYKDQKTKEISP